MLVERSNITNNCSSFTSWLVQVNDIIFSILNDISGIEAECVFFSARQDSVFEYYRFGDTKSCMLNKEYY